MSPREARIAPSFRVYAVRPEECLHGFRTVRVAAMSDPDLPLSFRSQYEEGISPRYRQVQHAALHTAVSFWRTPERANAVGAQFFPRHGEYVAHVILTFDHGFDYMDRAAELDPEHLTVWGRPERLAGAVVDIVPIVV